MRPLIRYIFVRKEFEHASDACAENFASPYHEAVRCDGQIIQCRVSMVLANDITGPLAIKSFRGMGAEKVFDKDRIALVMDLSLIHI